jgi:hypothetical protein
MTKQLEALRLQIKKIEQMRVDLLKKMIAEESEFEKEYWAGRLDGLCDASDLLFELYAKLQDDEKE